MSELDNDDGCAEFGQPAGRVYYIESSRKDSPPLDESKGRLPEADQSITWNNPFHYIQLSFIYIL